MVRWIMGLAENAANGWDRPGGISGILKIPVPYLTTTIMHTIRARCFPALFLIAAAGAAPALSWPVANDSHESPTTLPAVRVADPDITRAIESILEKRKIPGMAAGIVDTHGLVALGVGGVRARGNPAKIQANDRFHLGSCTKSMNATMIATLVEEGKLSWGTTVGEAFPTLRDGMDPAWRGVTLEQLLTNRSGAPNQMNADGLWGELASFAGSPTDARIALVEGITKNPPEAAPGSKFIYSNAGFSIAGAMAESITKIPWEDLMRRRIFEPLGMTTAGFGAPGHADTVDEPRGHHQQSPVAPGRGADNPEAISPAGRVHCSIGDWAKYVALHLRAGEAVAGLPTILKPATFAKLHAPAKGSDNEYAMGWGVAERGWAGGRVLTHSGSNTMWFCVTWLAPKKQFAVLVACNEAGPDAEAGCDEACGALIQTHEKQGR
jgi:CubicO group peptidase (beta-lactamase class C family)